MTTVTVVLPAEGSLLRIFIGEGERHEGRPLHEWLVLRARADYYREVYALKPGWQGH